MIDVANVAEFFPLSNIEFEDKEAVPWSDPVIPPKPQNPKTPKPQRFGLKF